MILDGKDGKLSMPQALNRAIVEANVAHLKPALEAVGVNGVAVILGGYIDPAGVQILDGVISPSVAKF